MNSIGNNAWNSGCYLTDKELENLIAQTEAEPMLHPPKEFQHEIIAIVRRKRQKSKNRKLFFYGMKVFAAAAAMLCILFIIPGDIRPEDRFENGRIQNDRSEPGPWMQEAEEAGEENLARQLNRQMNEYCSRLNGQLNQLVRMEVHFNEKEEK